MDRYGQYCPIAKALELLGEKWTLLIVRELLNGRTRFGELQRALPRLSPALLTKRLKQLEDAGLLARTPAGKRRCYALTEAGRDAAPIVRELGIWGIRWTDRRIPADESGGYVLMEDLRRSLNVDALPGERCVARFDLASAGRREIWWLVAGALGVDLCDRDPGHELDVHVTTTLQHLADYWFGHEALGTLRRQGALELRGRRDYVRSIGNWLGRSPLVASG